MIPKIIHQTWKTEAVPDRFRGMIASWRRRNPDWEYRFWTDAMLESLVAQHSPEFLPIYRNYPTGVQRSDAARYMILHKFGGVYADLDTTCLAPLDPLVAEQRVVLAQEPTEHNIQHSVWRGLDQIVFNGTMASPAGHPFWPCVFKNLRLAKDARNTLDATGPLLLTGCLRQFEHPSQLALNSCHLFNELTSTGQPSQDQVFGPYGHLRLSVHHWAGTWYTIAARTRRQQLKKTLRQLRYRLTRGNQFSLAETTPSIDHDLLASPLAEDFDFASQKISCLIPLRDAEPHLDRCVELLMRLDHPRENLSVTFCEGDSRDRTRQKLSELVSEHRGLFRDIRVVHLDVGTVFSRDKRWLPHLQRSRRAGLARVRNKLIDVGVGPEDDWVLWLDADLADYPLDILHSLMAQGEKIVVPNCVHEPGGKSFDMNSFVTVVDDRDHNYYKFVKRGLYQPNSDTARRLHLHDLRYLGRVPLNGVGGTMMLVHASVHRAGVRFPEEPYQDLIETEGFGQLARDLDVTPVGLPNLEIIHPKC
jgi:Anp1/Glycosyltransferase sugar-binding region containing DXD motif